jgi:shikimate dehydrogenase
LGCPQIHVVGRNPENLTQFERSWQQSNLADRIQTHPWEQLAELLPHTALLVNTTPIGMTPHTERSPLDLSLMEQLPTGTITYDLIYTPNPTVFLSLAQQRGLMAINGLEMLVQQGAIALQIWCNCPAPVAVMRQTLRHHLTLT